MSCMHDPPQRPDSEGVDQINFERQPMVEWLSPGQLVHTARKVVLSAMFADYADKREIEAIASDRKYCYEDVGSDLWIDFVADAGDGFNSAYTIASLLAEEKLNLRNGSSGDVGTRRGRILVMGGDQVYPCPNIEGYEDHLRGPYRAALPYTADDHPHLFAIPGNHDWYDGLTAFMRMFCQKQWIGGWELPQARSYFAIQLPHRWWLFGIDIQFDTYIDSEQIDYFKQAAKKLQAGDSVILCTAKPSWVEAERGKAEAFRYLDYFERTVVDPENTKARVRLCLTGDAHHYARYFAEEKGIHRITAGGGGAYLSATHHLPKTLTVPPKESRDAGKSPPVEYERQATFPSLETSQGLRRGIFGLCRYNRGFRPLVAAVYAAYGMAAGVAAPGNDASVFKAMGDTMHAVIRSPLAMTLTLVLLGGLVGFVQAGKSRRALALGAGHLAAHLIVITLALCATGALIAGLGEPFRSSLFILTLAFVGAWVGTQVFALYLLIAERHGYNTNELFAALRIEDYKGFVRLHLREDGVLDVYPVGVERVCRAWKLHGKGWSPEEPWFVPDCEPPLQAHLIEGPIHINPREEQ